MDAVEVVHSRDLADDLQFQIADALEGKVPVGVPLADQPVRVPRLQRDRLLVGMRRVEIGVVVRTVDPLGKENLPSPFSGLVEEHRHRVDARAPPLRKDILGPRFHKAGEGHDLCKTDFEMLAPEEQKKYEVILEPGAEPVSPRHAASKLDDELLATATDPTSLQFVVRARWAASLVSIAIYVLVSRLLLDNECPCTVIPGPVKQVERMVFKSGVRYGLDFRKCKDLARLTIQVANLAVAAMALRLLLASGLIVIVNHKHRFAANYPVITVGGYRDYQLICLIRIGGVWRVCELQINLEIFVEIKQTSHGPFEVARTLEAFSVANTQYKGDLQAHVLEKVQNGVLLSLDMTGNKLTAAQLELLVQAMVHDTSRLQELVSVPSLHPDVQRQP